MAKKEKKTDAPAEKPAENPAPEKAGTSKKATKPEKVKAPKKSKGSEKGKTSKKAVKSGKEKKPSRKERKQQEKALLKTQLELETQLVNEGKIPARNKYRCKNFFGRAVALCLVFLFGILSTVGAFLGFGAFAPSGTVLGLFGVNSSNLLYEQYAAQSFFDIARDIMRNPFDSLESLAKYSPVVDKYVDTLAESMAALGVQVDKPELKSTKFQNLGAYFRDEVLGGVVLGEALHVTPNDSNRMMVAICYGNKDEDYVVDGAGKIVPITPPTTLGQLSKDSKSVIDRVNVEDAFGVTAQSNDAMRFLAYGTEGFNYTVNAAGEVVMLRNELTGELFRKKTLANLSDDSSAPLETAKISDLITVESETGLLAAIKDWTTGDLKQNYRIERLRVGQVMTIGDNASLIAKAIKDWRLCDIKDPNKMDTLKLGQIIEIKEDSPPLLKSLKDTQIGELDTAVDELRLIDILKEEDFKDNNYLQPLKLTRLPDLGADLKKLSAREIFGDEMYAYREIKPEDDKSVFELYTAYKTGHSDAEGSKAIPKKRAIDKAAGETLNSYFEPNAAAGTRVVSGFYKTADGGYEVVAEKDVHTRKVTPVPEGPETVEYYIEGEQKLTPSTAWRYVNYEGEPYVRELPEGDVVSSDPTATDGCIIPEAKGEIYSDAKHGNRPWYYITTRIKFENGVATEETEKVAYPVMQDANGLYYTYIKYTPGGGPAEFREMRVDLEEEIVLYTYGEGESTVTLTKNAAGKWSYKPTPTGEEEPQEVVVNVYTHAEETRTESDPETGEPIQVTVPAYDYIKTEIPVEKGYYAESVIAQIEAAEEAAKQTGIPAEPVVFSDVYGEGEVTEKFEIVKTVEGEISGDPVPVERYLSGVWFFLFGGEGEGCFTDSSDMRLLDLTGEMNGLSETLSNTVMWELYFHGLLTENPFADLKEAAPGGVVGEEKTVTNLNECTLNESIELVKKLVALKKAEP